MVGIPKRRKLERRTSSFCVLTGKYSGLTPELCMSGIHQKEDTKALKNHTSISTTVQFPDLPLCGSQILGN